MPAILWVAFPPPATPIRQSILKSLYIRPKIDAAETKTKTKQKRRRNHDKHTIFILGISCENYEKIASAEEMLKQVVY